MRLLVLVLILCSISVLAAETKPRLMILTDIGGDPDDQQSLIRLMHYSNEFDIEGLIATSSGTLGELPKAAVKTELVREIVEAYGQVRDNLALHAQGFPQVEQLRKVIKSGNKQRGKDAIGEEHDSEASRWIIAAADRNDERPLNIAVWGGQTDLAQALWRVRTSRDVAGLKKFLSRLRVYDIDDQDGLQSWLFENFPDLFYVLSKHPPGKDKREGGYRGMYLGGDESSTSTEWLDKHLRKDHGPLGALYPVNTWTAPNPHSALKEGDTPSWFYFLTNGVNDPAHPEWGGWGGRFRHEKQGLWLDAADQVGREQHARVNVWRWRPVFQNEFAARADWCVKPKGEANHAAVIAINGDRSRAPLLLKVAAGGKTELSATDSTDPDGDKLTFNWWQYREAGTYDGAVILDKVDSQQLPVNIPPEARGKTIHLILEATDDGQPPLTTLRRVVLQVK
jgi:hypothetical protein